MPQPNLPRIALLLRSNLSAKRDVLMAIGQWAAHTRAWNLEYLDNVVDSNDWVVSSKISGIIAWADSRHNVEFLKKQKVPVVEMGNLASGRHPCIQLDNRKIGACVARHFRDRGLRHFAFFGERLTYRYSLERLGGFQSELRLASGGVPVFNLQEQKVSMGDWQAIIGLIGEWLRGLPKPVGILADRDGSGSHLLAVCRREGLAVPDAISICGVGGDSILCHLGSPPLSSVALPAKAMAHRAIELINAQLAGKSVGRRMVYDQFHVTERASSNSFAEEDPVVLRALIYIRDHFSESPSVDEVAATSGVSRRVLERRFKTATGRTVLNEVHRVRGERARALLTESDLSIAEIADLCGFTEPQRLAEAFRRQYGKTPSEVRGELK